MARFLVRRLIISLVTLVGISILVFLLMRLAPGDPVDIMLRGQISRMSSADIPLVRELLTREFGLDQPLVIQYLSCVREVVLHGSLGYSFVNSQPALGLVLWRFGATMELMSVSLVLSLLV